MPREQDDDYQHQAPGADEPQEPQQQEGPAGEASPGLKDKEARTSDSYGKTRESGEKPKP